MLGYLGEYVGRRPPTSPEEATAAAYVNARLRRAGMGVSTYELRATPRAGGTYAALATAGLAAAVLTPFGALPSLLLALGTLVALLIDALTTPLAQLGRRRASQNIVGTRPIAGAGGLVPAEPRWRVVLLAPLDSAAVPRGLAALAGRTRGATLLRLLATTLVAVGALLQWQLPGLWWPLQIPSALVLALVIAGAAMPSARPAADGGLAALTALMAVVQRLGGLERVELWAVAVGAASTDPGGSASLLGRYPFDRERTLLIGLEQLSGSQIVYATREGALFSRSADALLLRLADAADAADAQIDAEPRSLSSDGGVVAPLRRLGYRTLTVLARPEPGTSATATDPRLVERATRLVVSVVRQLEAES